MFPKPTSGCHQRTNKDRKVRTQVKDFTWSTAHFHHPENVCKRKLMRNICEVWMPSGTLSDSMNYLILVTKQKSKQRFNIKDHNMEPKRNRLEALGFFLQVLYHPLNNQRKPGTFKKILIYILRVKVFPNSKRELHTLSPSLSPFQYFTPNSRRLHFTFVLAVLVENRSNPLKWYLPSLSFKHFFNNHRNVVLHPVVHHFQCSWIYNVMKSQSKTLKKSRSCEKTCRLYRRAVAHGRDCKKTWDVKSRDVILKVLACSKSRKLKANCDWRFVWYTSGVYWKKHTPLAE